MQSKNKLNYSRIFKVKGRGEVYIAKQSDNPGLRLEVGVFINVDGKTRPIRVVELSDKNRMVQDEVGLIFGAPKGSYFHEYDEDSATWCVFHTDQDPGFAYESYSSEGEAEDEADRLNAADTKLGCTETGMATEQEHRDRSISFFRGNIPKRAKIYSQFVKSTDSGRCYRVFAVVGDGSAAYPHEIREITRSASQVCALRWRDVKPAPVVFLKGHGFSGPQSIAERIGDAVWGDPYAYQYADL